MKSIEEIKELIRIFQHDVSNRHIGEQHKIEMSYALLVLEWILKDSIDGNKIIDSWVDDNGQRNIIILEDLLCYTCFHRDTCEFKDAPYNIGDSCLADK